MKFFLISLSVFVVILAGCFFPRTHDFTNEKEMWGGFVKGGKYLLVRDVFITRNNNDYWEMSPSFDMYNNVYVYPDSLNIMNKMKQFDREQYEYVAILKKNTRIELIGLMGEDNYSIGHTLRMEAKILDGEHAGRIVNFDRMCYDTGKKVRGFSPVRPNEYYMKAIESQGKVRDVFKRKNPGRL